MNTQIITITPAIAKALLVKTNTKNIRHISSRVVTQYAQDMKTGKWVTTHQGLAFTGENLVSPGQLIDGQHRLAAIVSANVAVEMTVTFGAPDVRKIDFGRRRELSLVTGIPKKALGVAGVVIHGITACSPSPTQKQLLCEKFPELGEIHSGVTHISFLTRTQVEAAFSISKINGVSEAHEWYQMMTQNSPCMPAPIRYLRSRLEREHKVLFSNQFSRPPAYALALECISCANEKRDLAKISFEKCIEYIPQNDGLVGQFVREHLL